MTTEQNTPRTTDAGNGAEGAENGAQDQCPQCKENQKRTLAVVTCTIDRLFLELSQVTKATTKKERRLKFLVIQLLKYAPESIRGDIEREIQEGE